jgi:phage terminase large subunit
MASDLADYLLYKLEASTRVHFPSPVYQREPVAFCRNVLGVEPWSAQVRILEAVRDHLRVAVRSGHKIGKSRSAAIVAWWYFCSFPDARVVMSSTTARQVDQILWREVRMVRSRGGRCVDCRLQMEALMKAGTTQIEAQHRVPRPCPHSALIEEEPGELARTGVKSDDFREIQGFTAKEAEAVAGISGEHLLYIIDEASGVPQLIFDALEGNRAGGARMVMFSNPTRNEGEFYEAFHSKSAFYHGITVSSEETPNVVSGKKVVPGLATAEWIAEKKLEWGEDSPLYKIRVRGEHATHEEGKIFSVHAITEAESRWPETPEQGRLYIGLDVAGATGLGDEIVYAPRRGLKCFEMQVHRGLSRDAILTHLIGLLTTLKLPRETPVVVLDSEGQIGSEVYGKLLAYLDRKPGAFELVPMRASDRAHRQPDVYHRQRDCLTANLERFLRDGGAIPTDTKLAAELHAMEWKQQANGLLKVTPKEDVRKLLGRSPDRYDALTLACWEPLSLREEVDEDTKRKVAASGGELYAPTMDPYAAADAWKPK